MLIGLCGPICAGKRSVSNFLVSELGFTCVPSPSSLPGLTAAQSASVPASDSLPLTPIFTPPPSDTPADSASPPPSTALISQCWRRDINVVITSIDPGDAALPALLKRPYFLLIHVCAPALLRFERAVSANRAPQNGLRDFLVADEARWGLADVARRNSRLVVLNDSQELAALHASLRAIDVTNVERLRPGWDSYFMSLAELASERTNCMKRRVGCVIVKDRRLVATGYNGTPSRVRNCMEGGCPRCNGAASKQGVGLDLCLCLHAEENAIIEAGRERCEGGTLYTNLFPCILCAKKIIQAGILRVVYAMNYATDDASNAMLHAGQVRVELHKPFVYQTALVGYS